MKTTNINEGIFVAQPYQIRSGNCRVSVKSYENNMKSVIEKVIDVFKKVYQHRKDETK